MKYPAYIYANHCPEIYDKPLLTLVPPGYTGHLRFPERQLHRVKQTVQVEDIGALEDYLLHQVTTPETLAIYVTTGARQFKAVLDHCKDAATPGTNEHTVTLALSYSEEFKPLEAVFNKEMEQGAFMEFLEEHASLFIEAGPLLTMVQTFSNVTVTRFKSAKNLDNGTGQLLYSTEENPDESTKVPREVSAVMPIFHGQPPAHLNLRLRYLPRGGTVKFMLVCHGFEKLMSEQMRLVETRLREWIKARAEQEQGGEPLGDGDKPSAWNKVLVVRVDSCALAPPDKPGWRELKGSTLPAPLVTR